MTTSGYRSTVVGPMVVGVGWNRGLSWLRPWAEDWGWGLRLMWGSGIGVEVRIGVVGVVGFRCSLCLGFLFFILVVGGWGCCWWWWLWLWLWPWLEVMSLKSSGHGGFEGKYRREGESSRFVPWVFFFFFFGGWGLRLWLVVVVVAVAVVYRWWAWKAQAMEVLRANIKWREKLHRVEKDGKTVVEREIEREWEIIKKWIKNNKERIFK